MAKSTVNVLHNDISTTLPVNIEMLEPENCSVHFTGVNYNLARNIAPVDSLLRMADENGARKYNIFIMSSESNTQKGPSRSSK